MGQKNANGLGLYDMSGNVWEWMWDRFRYGGLDERVLTKSRVYRGGSWDSGMERTCYKKPIRP